jgi:hypothetical protein
MAYDAITIETNNLHHSGISLETGLLGQLEQFKDAPVDFVLSEIVTREVLKHLQQMAKDGRDKGGPYPSRTAAPRPQSRQPTF